MDFRKGFSYRELRPMNPRGIGGKYVVPVKTGKMHPEVLGDINGVVFRFVRDRRRALLCTEMFCERRCV